MTRRWTWMFVLVCLKMVVAAPAPNPTTDDLGFSWNINGYGTLESGTNYALSNVPMIAIQNGNFNMQGQSVEGDFLVYNGNWNNMIQLVRRVRIDTKGGVGYWIDTLTYSGNNPNLTMQATTLSYQIHLRNRGQGHFSNSGATAPTVLAKGDTGLIILNDQNHAALLLGLSSSNSKDRPTISNQNNYRYTIDYPLNLKPGETVSYAISVAQRMITAVPSAKELKSQFKPLNLRYAVRGLPRELRKTLVNTSGRGDTLQDDRDNLMSLLEELGVERGSEDMLCLSETARLKGTARIPRFEILTSYGRVAVEPGELAAIRCLNRLEGTVEVHLCNGQVLAGKVALDKPISFETHFGSTIDLDLQFVRALIMRVDANETLKREQVAGFLLTQDGGRFALSDQGELRLHVVLPWGERQIAYRDLLSVSLVADWLMYGYAFVLQDGSRFRGYLVDDTLTFQTQSFGPVKVARVNLVGLKCSRQKPAGADQEFEDELHVTNARLWGDAILVGEIDVDKLHFNNEGAIIEIPPAQLRSMTKTSEPDPDNPRDPRYFEGVLWSGDLVSGGLVEPIIPLRSGGTILEIPASHFMEYRVPAPTLPDSMKERIDRLVVELGHEDWTVRDKATASLAGFGAMAEAHLKQVLNLSSDPEVKRRLEKILSELE